MSYSDQTIDDARANLTQIAALLAARDVPVMVAREGVVPDPSVLDGYGDMLASWAAETENVTFVDAAATLEAITALMKRRRESSGFTAVFLPLVECGIELLKFI